LVVEGKDDLGTVIGLMRHHIAWPPEEIGWPVCIDVANGADEILSSRFISTKLKTSGLKILGIMLDADDNFSGRVTRLHSLCSQALPAMPTSFPATGLIVDNADGMRVGIWIMPDNRSHGMLETLLKYFVPSTAVPLWTHAEESVMRAMELQCPCRPAHLDKARIHTWLAWQDPPGERLGSAITKKILDPNASTAMPFVAWFRELYGV
jgi:hypothetical protein